MERAIITISESGRVNIPSNGVWMSEMELVELFGVIAPTLRAALERYTRVKCFALQLPNDVTRLFLQVGQHSTTLKWSLLLHSG